MEDIDEITLHKVFDIAEELISCGKNVERIINILNNDFQKLPDDSKRGVIAHLLGCLCAETEKKL